MCYKIKELLVEARRHGILTPYTSFLSEENTAADLAGEAGARKTAGLVERLGEAEGQAAFVQRAEKKALQQADKIVALDSPVNRLAGGAATVRDIDTDKDRVVNAVQVVGNQVLFRRGNAWCAYEVAKTDLAQSDAKVKVIERFSEEYFRLIREATPEQQRMLADQKEGEKLILPAARQAADAAAPAEAAEAAGEVYRVK